MSDCTPAIFDIEKRLIYIYRAGLFWASEGAVALGYPEPAKRGKYMKYLNRALEPIVPTLISIVFGYFSVLEDHLLVERLC